VRDSPWATTVGGGLGVEVDSDDHGLFYWLDIVITNNKKDSRGNCTNGQDRGRRSQVSDKSQESHRDEEVCRILLGLADRCKMKRIGEKRPSFAKAETAKGGPHRVS
jgi:hypothetical protein